MATAQDLKTRLRLRLGEVSDGTWAHDTGYQDEANSGNTTPVDELLLVLNEAQVSVLRDIFTHQFIPFARLNTTIPIESEETEYTLPADYIQMIDIYHNKPNEPPLKIEPKMLSYYREVDPNLANSSAVATSYYQYYDIPGQTGVILADGTVTWTGEGSRTQFAADNTNLEGVREGDIVQNITDGSEGIITNFGSGIADLGDGLHGGRANIMRYGDEFIIQSREEERFTLEVWPSIKISSPEISYTVNSAINSRMVITPNQSDTFESVSLRLPQALFLTGGVLENYNIQDRLLLHLRRIDDIDNHEFTTIDIFGFQDAKAGYNTLRVIESEINKGHGYNQLERGQQYDMFLAFAPSPVQPIDQPDSFFQDGLLVNTNDVKFIRPSEEFLSINYVKRPARFISNLSRCELPEELHEPLIEKAALTAMRKIDPSSINASLLQHYKILIEDVKNYLVNQQPPHAQTIDNEEARGVSTFTPGFSSYYW